ncbi:hypothetical protein MTO96_014325 [Rhipicephalus appendiculatus]
MRRPQRTAMPVLLHLPPWQPGRQAALEAGTTERANFIREGRDTLGTEGAAGRTSPLRGAPVAVDGLVVTVCRLMSLLEDNGQNVQIRCPQLQSLALSTEDVDQSWFPPYLYRLDRFNQFG